MNGSRVSRAPLRRCSTSWVAAALAAAVALLIAVPQTQAAATQPPQPRVGPGRQRLPHAGCPRDLGRQRCRRLVRVRADQAAAGDGAAGDHHARLLRVLGLRPDVRADPAHGAGGQRRHLPALADRRRDALPGAVRHRAVHDLGGQRHPRRPGLPARAQAPGSAATRTDQLLRLLVRRDHHRRTSPTATGSSDLPKPRAIFLDDPHDGGLHGLDEPALDDSLGGHPGVDARRVPLGRRRRHQPSRTKADASCNAVFPKLEQIPEANKDLVLTSAPTHHGRPALSSDTASAREHRGWGIGPRQRLRLELLLEGLGRAAQLRLPRHRLPLRAGRHPAAPLHRQLERRRADHPVEGPASRPHPRRARTPAPARSACGPAARRTTQAAKVTDAQGRTTVPQPYRPRERA